MKNALPAKRKSPEGWKDTERTLCVSCIATNKTNYEKNANLFLNYKFEAKFKKQWVCF